MHERSRPAAASMRQATAVGLAAGAAGTVAMDLLWYARYRRDGGDDSFSDWEFSTNTTSFDDAGAPAQVGRRMAHALHVDLPDEAAGTTNNVVHWATGAQWGIAYAVTTRLAGRRSVGLGAVLGAVACGTSYLLLGAAGIYKPIWEYDRVTLLKDFDAHLVFGLTTALVARSLTQP